MKKQNAKTRGRKDAKIALSNRRGRSASRWRILGRAAGESAILLSSRCPRFLPRLAQGCGRRPPMPANRKESLCVLASLRSAVQHRLNRCIGFCGGTPFSPRGTPPRRGRKIFIREYFPSPLRRAPLPFPAQPLGLRPGLLSFGPGAPVGRTGSATETNQRPHFLSCLAS